MTSYFLAQEGHKGGPYTHDEAQQRIRPGTLVWRQGLAEWSDAAELAELGNVESPPPLPPDLISAEAARPLSLPEPGGGTGAAQGEVFVLKKVGIFGRRFLIEDRAGGTLGYIESDRLYGDKPNVPLASLVSYTRFLTGKWIAVHNSRGTMAVKAHCGHNASRVWWKDDEGAKRFKVMPYGGSPPSARFCSPDKRVLGCLTLLDALRGTYELEVIDARALHPHISLLIAACCTHE